MRHDEKQPTCNSEGHYANYFKIGYNDLEFIIDFYQSYSEDKEIKFSTRIITNPIYAKALVETLQQSIHKYEKEFGSKFKYKNENT